MALYPVTGPASTIACPRHGLAVALGEDGRIVSTCSRCVREALTAEGRMVTLRVFVPAGEPSQDRETV